MTQESILQLWGPHSQGVKSPLLLQISEEFPEMTQFVLFRQILVKKEFLRHLLQVSSLAHNIWAIWCHCVCMIKWGNVVKKDSQELFGSVQLCTFQRYAQHNEGSPHRCHPWWTHPAPNHTANGEIVHWDTKKRHCCWRLWWHLSSEIGCIMADLFMVLMYQRGAHMSVSVSAWMDGGWRFAGESMWHFFYFFFKVWCFIFSDHEDRFSAHVRIVSGIAPWVITFGESQEDAVVDMSLHKLIKTNHRHTRSLSMWKAQTASGVSLR